MKKYVVFNRVVSGPFHALTASEHQADWINRYAARGYEILTSTVTPCGTTGSSCTVVFHTIMQIFDGSEAG